MYCTHHNHENDTTQLSIISALNQNQIGLVSYHGFCRWARHNLGQSCDVWHVVFCLRLMDRCEWSWKYYRKLPNTFFWILTHEEPIKILKLGARNFLIHQNPTLTINVLFEEQSDEKQTIVVILSVFFYI